MLSFDSFATMFLATLFPLIFVFCTFLRFVMRKRDIASRINKIPGPKRHFFWGNAKDIAKPGEHRLQKWYVANCVKYKTAYSYRMGPLHTTLALCHPKSVKELLRSSEPKMVDDKRGYNLLLDWLGKGLLINNGAGWLRNRRLLTPAFHFDTLKPYMNIYNKAADILLDKFSQGIKECTFIEIYEPVSLFTLDVMLKCAFSFKDDVQGEGNPLLMFDWIYYRTENGRTWLASCDYAHQVAYNLIRKRKKELNQNGVDHSRNGHRRSLDFLDVLLLARDENNEGLTETEIRQEVDTFLFEGHDTTASGISWCMYMLASHPEYQNKAREEVDQVLDGRDDDVISWDDLNKFPYLTMCIKESLRYNPPVYNVGRTLENPFVVDGVTMKPGTQIIIQIYGLHHNPLVWGEDHMEYKPERFELDKMRKMDSHAFIPFSAGTRNCIGQNFAMNEMKTVIAKTLHRFNLYVDPDRKPERQTALVLRAVNGIHLRMEPRNDS